MPVVIAPLIVATVMNAARRRREEEARSSRDRGPMSSHELRRLMADMERDRMRREKRIVHPLFWMILAAVILTAALVATVCLILTVQGVPLPPLTREGFLHGPSS